jgi:hypothetical protein
LVEPGIGEREGDTQRWRENRRGEENTDAQIEEEEEVKLSLNEN